MRHDDLEFAEERQFQTVDNPEGKDAYRKNLPDSYLFKFFQEAKVKVIARIPGHLPLFLDLAGTGPLQDQIVGSRSAGQPCREAAESRRGRSFHLFSYSLDLGGDLKFQDRVTGCRGPVMLSRVSEYDVYTRYYNRYDIL